MSPSQNTSKTGDKDFHEGVVWRRNDVMEDHLKRAKPGEAEYYWLLHS